MLRKTLTSLAALAAAGLVLAGCASGSTSGGAEETTAPEESSAPEELIPITVGLLKIAPSAAVQLGIDEGIFEKNGLDVSVQFGQGGAALLPAVSSGSIQFAVGNPLSVLVASSQGLGMSIVSGYSNVDVPEDAPPSGVTVMADSGISSWKDLEGKTVAINAVNTQGDLTIRAEVDADGGDSSLVTFTEIPFPDQLAQLEQGRIDATWTPEPFLSAAAASEGTAFLGDPLRYIPGLYTMVGFTSTAYAEENPEVVEAFIAAIEESTALAMSDEAAYRAAIATFTGMDAGMVDTINLENLSGDLDRGIIEELSALALEYEFLETEPDLDTVIWE